MQQGNGTMFLLGTITVVVCRITIEEGGGDRCYLQTMFEPVAVPLSAPERMIYARSLARLAVTHQQVAVLVHKAVVAWQAECNVFPFMSEEEERLLGSLKLQEHPVIGLNAVLYGAVSGTAGEEFHILCGIPPQELGDNDQKLIRLIEQALEERSKSSGADIVEPVTRVNFQSGTPPLTPPVVRKPDIVPPATGGAA